MQKNKIVLALLICVFLDIYLSCTNTTKVINFRNSITREAIVANITNINTEEETQEEATTLFEGYSSVPLSNEVQSQINDICVRYDIPFELMLGIAKQESSFDVNAYNETSGDYGLFQINAKTWNDTAIEINHSDYKTDVVENTEMACYIFDYCLEVAGGDTRTALNYYRTGTPNDKYEAGSDYATIVLENYKNIKETKKNDYCRLQQNEY